MADGATDNIFSLINLGGLLTGGLIVVAMLVLARLLGGTLGRLGNRFVERRLQLNQLDTLLRFFIYLVGISLAVVSSIRLSKEVVLALTGTAAVTIGFALKDLAASVLAGIVIIIDRPFQVGDRVTFAGVYGEISAIGLRSVRLVTLDDNVVTIPNNKFLTDVVSSGNWGALDMLIQMDFFIGSDQDVALAHRLVEECLTSNRYAFLQKPWVVLVNQVMQESYFAVRLRAKAYVLDVKYEKAFETDVTERVLDAFRLHHIQPPAVLHRSVEPAPPADLAVAAQAGREESRLEAARARRNIGAGGEEGAMSEGTRPSAGFQLPQPGPEHRVLEKDVGVWDAEVVVCSAPGAPAIPSRGVSESRLACNGLWLLTDFRNETTGFEGHGVFGYDPARGRYTGVWVDPTRTFLAVGEGTWDADARTMTMSYSFTLPGGEVRRWREVTEARDADTHVFRSLFPLPDGSEFEVMRVTYRRRRAA